MRFQDINRNPTTKILRQFGGLAAIILLAFSTYHYVWQDRWLLGVSLAISAVLFGCLSWLQPKWLGPIFVTWMIVAFPIGWLVSNLVLALIFYGCLVPLGWILRLRGHDPLRLKRPTGSSYWQDSPPHTDIRRYLKQY